MTARRVAVAPRRDVALMAGYHSPQLDVAVRLNTNEAPEPPPAGFVDELQEELAKLALNRYPDRAATELRRSIARHHGVEPEQVFAANGSNEVLQSLLLAYGGPRRCVAVFEPTYALHAHIAKVTGTAVVEGGRDAEFLLEAAEIDRVFERAAIISEERAPAPVITFLCSPNNPTGRLEPEGVVEAVLERAPGLVVVDEAYGQFAPRSSLELIGAFENLVVVRTFSKTWSLAGLRLGYAIAAPEIIAAMERVVLPYHLDAFKQVAGRVALRYEDAMRARVARLVDERARLIAGLKRLGCALVPSDANFVLFSHPLRPGRELWERLVAASVLVRDVSGWPRLAGWLRVTVGTPEEDDRFLVALEDALA